MNSETIVMCVVALILGMLLANMLKSVCGCKVVEGTGTPPPPPAPAPPPPTWYQTYGPGAVIDPYESQGGSHEGCPTLLKGPSHECLVKTQKGLVHGNIVTPPLLELNEVGESDWAQDGDKVAPEGKGICIQGNKAGCSSTDCRTNKTKNYCLSETGSLGSFLGHTCCNWCESDGTCRDGWINQTQS
jgi:hypothetical protein